MAKKDGWPRRGELVIGTIGKVSPFSATVKLDEYGIEGMIHISEVSRRWVKDIKKVIKPGQKIVALVVRIDREKGHLNLSLKKVNKYDAEEKLKVFKREQKADKMLRVVAKKLGMKLDEAYDKIGFKLQKEFEEMFKAFQEAALEGEEVLIQKGFDKKQAKVIAEVAKDQLEAKEAKMKKTIELKSFEPDGVNIIKKILSDVQKKYDIDINYISAPEYTLALKTKSAKEGDRTLTDAVNEIKEKIGSKGECELKGD